MPLKFHQLIYLLKEPYNASRKFDLIVDNVLTLFFGLQFISPGNKEHDLMISANV